MCGDGVLLTMNKKHRLNEGSILSTAQIVLVILKCFELISWPWAAVLIPVWILIGYIVIFVLSFIIYGLMR